MKTRIRKIKIEGRENSKGMPLLQGDKEHLTKRIVKESLRFLIIAVIISTIGGAGLKSVEDALIVIIPFLIVLPALNNAAGDFAIIMVSRFTTYLYKNKGADRFSYSREARHIFRDVLLVALLLSVYLAILAAAISSVKGFPITYSFFLKFSFILLVVMLSLFLINFLIAVIGGIYVFKRGADPDDVLIPLTTSISDLVGMVVLALLVSWLF